MHEVWSIEQSWVGDIGAVLAAGPPLRAASRKTPKSSRAVAVVPVYGVLDKRVSFFAGTSPQEVVRQVRQAASDPAVSSILLLVDSPGGHVEGITEAAAAIRAARERKPIVAAVDGVGASAAYWLAAQADDVYASPSATVGGVGVFGIHADVSAALATAGIKMTGIEASPDKTKLEAAPWRELGLEARAHLQSVVDAAAEQFYHDLSQGRRISRASVKAKFSGRVQPAQEALRRRWVDGVRTPEAVLRELVSGSYDGPTPRHLSDPGYLAGMLALHGTTDPGRAEREAVARRAGIDLDDQGVEEGRASARRAGLDL